MAKKKERKSIGMKLNEKFLSIDWFGAPVTFMIDGDSTFKSMLGACATLLISLWCLIYFYDEIKDLIHGAEVSLIATNIVKGAFPPDYPLNLSERGIHFAVALSSKRAFSEESSEDFS